MTHEMGTSDVDAYTLLRSMPESQQRAVRDAWRNPEPAASDGISAAVAINRATRQRRVLLFWAVGWSIMDLLAFMTSGAVRGVQVAGYTIVAGVSWVLWSRCQRNIDRLSSSADPVAASERAQTLRAERSRPAT